MSKRTWSHRHSLIKERILSSNSDIVCIQEADGTTFHDDFNFMMDEYDYVLHKKFRFRCATFYKRDRFHVDRVSHKDPTLLTSLVCTRSKRCVNDEECDDDEEDESDTYNANMVHIINCHLSGGAAPERRLRQVHDAIDQIRKWNGALQQELNKYKKQGNRQAKNIAISERILLEYQNAGIIVCGDFNSDGNTAVRKLLVDGCVEPDWRERK